MRIFMGFNFRAGKCHFWIPWIKATRVVFAALFLIPCEVLESSIKNIPEHDIKGAHKN